MKKPLSYDEFMAIYSKVPRLNVELVLVRGGKLLLTKRAITPYKGTWHLPGGAVHFGETFEQAVQRIAREELGIEATIVEQQGYIEYPSAGEQLEFVGWPMGVSFVIETEDDIQLDDEADGFDFFGEVPEDALPDQVKFISGVLKEMQ